MNMVLTNSKIILIHNRKPKGGKNIVIGELTKRKEDHH